MVSDHPDPIPRRHIPFLESQQGSDKDQRKAKNSGAWRLLPRQSLGRLRHEAGQHKPGLWGLPLSAPRHQSGESGASCTSSNIHFSWGKVLSLEYFRSLLLQASEMQTKWYELANLHHKMKCGEKERNKPVSLCTSDLYTIEYNGPLFWGFACTRAAVCGA